MQCTVQELTELVGGRLAGDGTIAIHDARTMSEAAPGHITFVENDKAARQLPRCQASALLARPDLPLNGKPIIQVADPLTAFLTIFRHFHGSPDAPPPAGIDAKACIHPTATVGADAAIQSFVTIGEGTVIGDRCRLYPGVVIGRNCRIGDDVMLYPHVVIYDGCTLGHRVIIHANAVIGADGFGYRFQAGRHIKVPQLGTVEIGDDVEIGACTTIDRGTFQATRIGAGTKIDNLVQIGHNCTLGRHNMIVSQVGIAGSCSTGEYVVLAGQAGIADHVHIGDRGVVGGQSGVHQDVPAGIRVFGSPARPEREAKRSNLSIDSLPQIRRDVRRIKQHLGLPDEE